MATSLRRLKVRRVSLVDNPASQEDGFGAFVTMFKRAGGKQMADPAMEPDDDEMMPCPDCKAKNKVGAKVCAGCGAGMPKKPMKAADRPKEDVMADEKLQADLKAAEELASEEQTKREEVEKRLAKVQAELDALKNTPEAVEKRALEALPESVRKRLAEAEERVTKLEGEREVAEYVAKAAEAGLPEDKGGLLLRVAKNKSTPEDFEALLSVLKALKAQVKTGGLFLVHGKGGDVVGDIATRIDARVKKAQEVDKSSYADATAKVAKEDPALYAEYVESVRIAK